VACLGRSLDVCHVSYGKDSGAGQDKEECNPFHLVLALVEPSLERCNRTGNACENSQADVPYKELRTAVKSIVDACCNTSTDKPANPNIISPGTKLQYTRMGATA